MTIRRHRRYSTDFKIQLVQAYPDGEGSVRTVADLKIGTVVRVFLEEGPCFGSCPGICGARSVQLFER